MSSASSSEVSELSNLKNEIDRLNRERIESISSGNKSDKFDNDVLNQLERIYFIILTIDFRYGTVNYKDLGTYILRWLYERDRSYYERLNNYGARTRMVQNIIYYLKKIGVLNFDNDLQTFTGLTIIQHGNTIPAKGVITPEFLGPPMCRLERAILPIHNGGPGLATYVKNQLMVDASSSTPDQLMTFRDTIFDEPAAVDPAAAAVDPAGHGGNTRKHRSKRRSKHRSKHRSKRRSKRRSKHRSKCRSKHRSKHR